MTSQPNILVSIIRRRRNKMRIIGISILGLLSLIIIGTAFYKILEENNGDWIAAILEFLFCVLGTTIFILLFGLGIYFIFQ